MNALEFNAKIENGVIHLPSKFREYDNAQVRIIILAEKPAELSHGNQELLQAMLALQEMDVFATITDPVKWQREQRDEWE